ncbi:hypothetical protein [Cyclobacterium marinum]|uniref:hypothetical protein n=1 Tax=Cyclobacterium marinum TaxID=104 RepID=UPI0018DBB681|nr:hypothetical protein [Cyclobacterium marinum]MBI0400713.1 hypothetical protein [Cyclobacterium marinum]
MIWRIKFDVYFFIVDLIKGCDNFRYLLSFMIFFDEINDILFDDGIDIVNGFTVHFGSL